MSNQGDLNRRHLWRLPITGGASRPVTTGAGIEYWPVFTSDGAALAYQASGARIPPRVELLRMRDIQTGPVAPNARQVLAASVVPAEFPASVLVEPRPVIFTSSDGVRVHGHLYMPPNYRQGQRYPALVFLHGGPNMQQVLGYHYHRLDYYQKIYAMNQYLAHSGYIVMSVNYRRGIGYGLAFREPEAPTNSDARSDPDVIDIIGAGMYLRSRPDVDPRRVGIWGGSAGGTRTILGLAFGSDIYSAGVALHGRSDQVIGKTSKWKAPVLLVHGDDDRNVPFSESVAVAAELRKNDVTVEQLMIPNEGHSFFLYATWIKIFETTADFFDRQLESRAPTARTDGSKQ
jgi:dipeptidyl aminopeptidase/acylaminoacyl peptidase